MAAPCDGKLTAYPITADSVFYIKNSWYDVDGLLQDKRLAGEFTFKRGEEKGIFEFSGSTVVMLFQKNAITLDDAIYKNTRLNQETIVRMGYKTGEKTMPGKGCLQ